MTVPQRPRRLPPGRQGFPFFGEWRQLLFSPGFGAARRAEFGDVSRTRFLGRDMAMIFGAANNLLLFRGEHKSVEATWPTSTLRLLGPNTLSTQEGELHLQRRRLLAQAFRPRALAGYLPVMERRIAAAIEGWMGRGEFVLYPEIRGLTLEIAAALMLGAGERVSPALVHDFETFAGGLFSLPVDVPVSRFGRARRARQRLIAHLEAAIDARMATGEPGEDVLGLLLAARDDDGAALSRDELAEQMLVLLFAGHETLTSALSNFMMLMAQNPSVYQRICEEVERVTPAGPLSVDALAALVEAERALAETLRLYPPVAAAFRRCIRDFEVGGYTVPAGWLTGYRIGDTHHDPALYADPARFDPSRFAVHDEVCPHGRVHAQTGHDGRYLPFGGGARICLGMEFARLEMRAFVALLARRCAIALAPGQDLRMLRIPVPRPRSGLIVRLSPRGLGAAAGA